MSDLFDKDKKELRDYLESVNKEWKFEMKKGGAGKKDYSLEQKKNYEAHIKNYKSAKQLKANRNIETGTASDGFSDRELINEINLEELQAKELKEKQPSTKEEIIRHNQTIRMKKDNTGLSSAWKLEEDEYEELKRYLKED